MYARNIYNFLYTLITIVLSRELLLCENIRGKSADSRARRRKKSKGTIHLARNHVTLRNCGVERRQRTDNETPTESVASFALRHERGSTSLTRRQHTQPYPPLSTKDNFVVSPRNTRIYVTEGKCNKYTRVARTISPGNNNRCRAMESERTGSLTGL